MTNVIKEILKICSLYKRHDTLHLYTTLDVIIVSRTPTSVQYGKAHKLKIQKRSSLSSISEAKAKIQVVAPLYYMHSDVLTMQESELLALLHG